MVGYIGYGNAAGFLMMRGMMGSPGDVSSSDPNINPITGQIKEDLPDPMAGMSEEEKEREAEKLFVLFDRLQKTGVIQVVQDPNKVNQK